MGVIFIMKLLQVLLVLSSLVYMQEEVQLDTLLTNQQKMLNNQEKILNEVEYVDPLKGITFGVELNPVIFLWSSTQDTGFTVTGSVSLFSVTDRAEIAFPFYYATGENELKSFSLDCHYRSFIGKHRIGFYFSSGLRYTYLSGREGDSFFGISYGEKGEITSTSKLGVTFGIGYRKYGINGWYWGTSLFGGRYFSDEKTDYIGGGLANNKSIIDMELLKIGKLF